MKWNKLLAGVLTGAMLVTSVTPAFAAEEIAVEAEEIAAEEVAAENGDTDAGGEVSDANGLVAYYDFESDDLQGATAIVKGLGEYTGEVTYAEGKEGRAINLDGKYGLKLNKQNLGTDFTVSVWMKANNTLPANTCSGLFLGYHSPENWLSLAGDNGTTAKVWGNGGNYAWTTMASPQLTANEWHNLIIAGTDGKVRIFFDGEKVADRDDSNNPLSGTNQDIYLGVNYWDPCFPGLVDEVKVYNRALTDEEIDNMYMGLVAEYDFEDGIGDATAIVTGLGEYAGEPVYEEEGKKGKAIKIGDYGLKLNKENLGTEYAVSAWVKPEKNLATNQAGIFLGYHNPEKWIGLAGDTGATTKIWARSVDSSLPYYNEWATLAGPALAAGEWHHVLFTGTAGVVSAYVDGKKVVDNVESNDPLSGENQDIYLGVNNWDPEFVGLLDEVKIYGRQLTDAEALALYSEKSPQETLETEGFIATGSLTVKEGKSKAIKVTLPEIVEANGPAITFKSADTAVATVDAQGVVTAVAEGKTTVTTTVTLDKVTVTQETIVTVTGDVSYTEEDVNPFAFITEPETRMSVKAGTTVTLLTIPENIKDKVTVTYHSSNDAVVSYADGVVTALAAGKASVTAIVTANYNGYMMEYSTAFDVTSNSVNPTPTPVDPHKKHVGQTFVVNGLKYKVTADNGKVQEVRVTSLKNKKLKTLTIPKTVTNKAWKETFKVTSVKAKAFKGTAITKVTIGNNVTKIGPNAFLNCKKLKSVVIGKKVKTIGIRAFYGCKKLTKVTIKSTALKTVKKNAFKQISKKAVIKVPAAKKKAYKKLLKGKIAKGVKIK